jgi:hypothetical protein
VAANEVFPRIAAMSSVQRHPLSDVIDPWIEQEQALQRSARVSPAIAVTEKRTTKE